MSVEQILWVIAAAVGVWAAVDAIVATLVLRFVVRTVDPAIVREHWRRDPRTLRWLTAIPDP